MFLRYISAYNAAIFSNYVDFFFITFIKHGVPSLICILVLQCEFLQYMGLARLKRIVAVYLLLTSNQ